MSLQIIGFIVGGITLTFAYVISTMLVGRAEAEIAVAAGDDTPEETGFLSWDPFTFVDIAGFICVILLGMGWGRTVPFNPHNVTSKNKLSTALLVYMSQPLASLILVFVSLIATIMLIGRFFTEQLVHADLTNTVRGIPFQFLSQNYPYASPVTLTCATLLLGFVAFNSFNAVWTFINNGFHYFLFVGHERNHDYVQHSEAFTIFGPLVALILYFGLLRYVLLKYLIVAASSVATLFGAV
jgi:hypothetical protein